MTIPTWPKCKKSLGIEAQYYLKGDFNGDGASDFAIILAKDAAVKESDVDPPWRFRYRLAVAVFNGSAIGYTLSCFKEIESPLICFLRWEYDGGKGFFLGVYATDETYSFRPKAGTYVVE